MDDVLVWWAEATPPVDHAVGLLNPAERTRMTALRQQADRALFASAHVLLRRLIAEDAGVPTAAVDVVQQCDRCGHAHGQPHVVIAGAPGPAVSLAHAEGIVVVARAAHPVGVDLEPAGRVQPDVASVVLSAREQTELDAMAPADRGDAITRTWVRKEALLKAAGTGLLSDPRRLVLGPGEGPPIVVAWDRPGPWSVAPLRLARGYEGAVAMRSARMPEIVVRRVETAVVS